MQSAKRLFALIAFALGIPCGSSARAQDLPTPSVAMSLLALPHRDSLAVILTWNKRCDSACPTQWRVAVAIGENQTAAHTRTVTSDTVRVLKPVCAAPFRVRVAVVGDFNTRTSKAGTASLPMPCRAGAEPVTQPAAHAIDSPASTNDAGDPAPPRAFSTKYPITKRTISVKTGDDLQAAFNKAQPGDELVLANDAKFVGNFTLPARSDSGWVVIRSATVPAEHVRRDTTLHTARIVSPNNAPALQFLPGAHHYRIVGLELAHEGAIYNYGLVLLGAGGEPTLSAQPSYITLDRVYVHGSTATGNSRCLTFNGRYQAVIDSYIVECHAKGNDAQGIGGWSGAGPFLIENNRIEGSGQGIMFGGADPHVKNVNPSDIVIRRNYFYKPLAWAGKWTVKATFELKNAKRVLFEGNVLENHWADAQVGYVLLFQAVNQDGSAPWSTITDVMVRNNRIVNGTSAVDMLARFSKTVITPTSRVTIDNNLFEDVGRDPIEKSQGRIFQLLGELEDVRFRNNTVMLNGSAGIAVSFEGVPMLRLVMVDNVFPMTDYGVYGTGAGQGAGALRVIAPDAVFTGNVLPGQSAATYPPGNFFALPAPANTGVNMKQLNAAIAGVVK
ncbi:MAG: right-handed parallel beta-helix repeat-containing protein [Gemmatimonadaceae bacterium]